MHVLHYLFITVGRILQENSFLTKVFNPEKFKYAPEIKFKKRNSLRGANS